MICLYLYRLTDTKAEADVFIHRKESIRDDRGVRYTKRRRDIEAEDMHLKIIKLEDTVILKQCAIRMLNMDKTYDLTDEQRNCAANKGELPVGMAEPSTSAYDKDQALHQNDVAKTATDLNGSLHTQNEPGIVERSQGKMSDFIELVHCAVLTLGFSFYLLISPQSA